MASYCQIEFSGLPLQLRNTLEALCHGKLIHVMCFSENEQASELQVQFGAKLLGNIIGPSMSFS